MRETKGNTYGRKRLFTPVRSSVPPGIEPRTLALKERALAITLRGVTVTINSYGTLEKGVLLSRVLACNGPARQCLGALG